MRENLRNARKAAGLTQKQVAERLGISESEPFPQKRTEKQMKKRNKNKIKKSKVD